VRKHTELMLLRRHQAGGDLVTALAEQSGRKRKPGIWLQKDFPSISANVQHLEISLIALLSLITQ